MVGRRNRLTKNIIKILSENISIGIPNKYACALANISEHSFYDYRNIGLEIQSRLDNKELKEKDLTARDKLFLEFIQSVEVAKSKFIIHHVKNIATQSEKNMMGSQWLLSKADHANFGNVETVITAAMPRLIEFDDEN